MVTTDSPAASGLLLPAVSETVSAADIGWPPRRTRSFTTGFKMGFCLPRNTTDRAASKSRVNTVVSPSTTSKPPTTRSTPLGIVALFSSPSTVIRASVTFSLTWLYLPGGISASPKTSSMPVTATRSNVTGPSTIISQPPPTTPSATFTSMFSTVRRILVTPSGGASVTLTSSIAG